MAKHKKSEELNQILFNYHNTINDTLQLFEQSPTPTQDILSWNDVLDMSDHLSKQATIVGMLWTGEPPTSKPLKETMESYFNALQGFLLHCHGSTLGAGPTLSSSIQASLKQIVDSTFKLLHGSVSLYEGFYVNNRKPSITQLVGAVWEACSNLKKVPSTNIKAVRQGMTQVALSMKDVLREMEELKPACSSPSENHESDAPYSDEDDVDDLGDDLSHEELEVAKIVADVVSETLMVFKELIRAVTSMTKLENPENNGEFVDSLEKLMKLWQGIGVEIDELGACVYPPQDLNVMKQKLERIKGNIDEIVTNVIGFKNPSSSSSEAFLGTCEKLKILIEHTKTEMDSRIEAEVVITNMQNVTI